MSASTFFISQASVRHLKGLAEQRLSSVSSSHISEGLAAALNFRTNAALRSALKAQPTVEVAKPSNDRFWKRLNDIGYPVQKELKVLPELDKSYSPFKSFPLRATRSQRWVAWRNVVVAAVNAGLDQRLFGLSPRENWWPGGASDHHQCQSFTYEFVINGELKVRATVDAISGDELAISVVVSPTKTDVQPIFYSDLRSGDATAHCWLERRLGAWIQDGGDAFHCKRSLKERLSLLQIEPAGYSEQGSFIM